MDKPLTIETAKEIAHSFLQAYYQHFDNGPRDNLVSLYVPDAETSQMSFEGTLIRGQQAIVEKLKSLTFQKVQRLMTAVDYQITVEQGILINVIGQLKTDNDPPHSFTHTFYLRFANGSWFILNEIFRLLVHNI